MLVKNRFELVLVNTRAEIINDVGEVTLKRQFSELEKYSTGTNFSLRSRIKYSVGAPPGGIYSLKIMPANYRPIARFITVQETGKDNLVVVLPVDPGKVKRAIFKTYDQLPTDLRVVLERTAAGTALSTVEEFYRNLTEHERAGLFNIYAKMKATLLENNRNTFDYVNSLNKVLPARFYANVSSEMFDEVKEMSERGKVFDRVNGSLHQIPDNHRQTGSYKTRDRYGNLQLTFSQHLEYGSYMVDVDIDNSSGIEHIFDVITNEISNRDSHPYDIREILLRTQNLDPGYELIV